jgi:hypothetical protein
MALVRSNDPMVLFYYTAALRRGKAHAPREKEARSGVEVIFGKNAGGRLPARTA